MKSAARLYAVQALFQMEQSDQTVDQIVVEFLDHRFGASYEGEEMMDGDISLFQRLVVDAVNYQAPIDQLTDRALVANGRLSVLTRFCADCFAPPQPR